MVRHSTGRAEVAAVSAEAVPITGAATGAPVSGTPASGTPATDVAPLSDGDSAPEFVLPDQHGSEVSLARLRASGGVAVIFFPYAHTSICGSELRAVAESLGEFERLGVTPVAISCDSMFTLRGFADAEGIRFRLLSDFWPHGRVASAYGVFDAERGCALRGTFLLDRSGKVVWQVVNPLPQPRSLPQLLSRCAALSSGTAGKALEGTADGVEGSAQVS